MVGLVKEGKTGTGIATFAGSVAVGVGVFVMTGGNVPAATVAASIIGSGSALGAPPKGK